MLAASLSAPTFAMLDSDLQGLGPVSGAVSAGLGSQNEQVAKRRKLRHYDLLPAQLINSMGASGIESVDLPRLWQSMAAGNKVAESFSELCFDDAERRGVGLSRLGEVMVKTIDRLLESEHYRLYLKEELWTAVEAEARDLLPAFKAVHAGRGVSDAASSSIRAVAYHRPTQEVGDLTEHVEKIHGWLSRPQSALRSVIALLSAGGLFYVAQCHEKGARAWLAGGGGTMELMKEATRARRPVQITTGLGDLSGLSTQPR